MHDLIIASIAAVAPWVIVIVMFRIMWAAARRSNRKAAREARKQHLDAGYRMSPATWKKYGEDQT